jgi:2-C-methyl-D-erythritol 2,4-cyclodiphosphate synthase/2-C-methyl-D-erythritol 4-phosphate cytidylyltransferase
MVNKAAAIIAASGSSSRMNGKDKLLADIAGIPVVIRAVLAFEKAESIGEIIVAAKSENVEKIRSLCREHGISKPLVVTEGGENRQESVFNAVRRVSAGMDVIAIHDGARPYIKPEDIDRIVSLAREKGAVIPAVPVKETIKVVRDGKVIVTPDRNSLYTAQTPQAFLLENYLAGMANIRPHNPPLTDDAQLFENAEIGVYITEGDYGNIKITTQEDLNNGQLTIDNGQFMSSPAQLRIGSGYDVHRFAENRRLILCGVEIPHDEGLLGHSDADVAVHALMDALLGALALGDIGQHFPDTDEQYKDISSMELLGRVTALINERGCKPSNLDITIIAESPKLAPYILQMRTNIAEACNIPLGMVSVKATTEEGLGLAGKGIGASATCLLQNISVT